MSEDGGGRWLAGLGRSLAVNRRSRPLRRAQLSFLCEWTAEQSFAVALSVVAYGHGGAAAVGALTAARCVPAATAPFAATPVVRRVGALPVLVGSCTLRALATAGIALVVLGAAPFGWVYALAILSTAAHTVYRPAHSALLPPLCRSPGELVSANAVRGLSDSSASLIGPALAGVVLHETGAGWLFWAVTALAAAAAAAAAWVGPVEAMPAPAVASRPRPRPRRRSGVFGDSPDLRLIVAMGGMQTFVRGLLTVLLVIVSIRVLHTGTSGVGTLTAAIGAGALVGSAVVAGLGSRRLARWFGVGVALWGLPLAVLAATSSLDWALLALAPIGLGNALLDVSAFTLLGRLTTPVTAPGVFGALEGVIALGMAAGSLSAPALIRLTGTRGTLVLVGLAVPAVVAASWARLHRIDSGVSEQDGQIALLRRVDMLRRLPLPAVDQLARAAQPESYDAGATVFSQGEPGDRYFVIAAGQAEVLGDGRTVRTLGPGDGFGEIALLRRVPRTATVRATTRLETFTLSSAAFLAAVTGSAGAREQAAREVEQRLHDFTPGQRSEPTRDDPTLAAGRGHRLAPPTGARSDGGG